MNIIGVDVGNNTTKLYSLYKSNMNIIEGISKRYIPSAISFDNVVKCRYFGDESITKIISCYNTLTNLPSKLFNYKRSLLFDKNKYLLTGQYIYIMYINYIYNYLTSVVKTDTTMYIIPYPDYYNRTEFNTLKTSYEYSDFNTTPYYIPHSIAIGLEYGLYKSINNVFKKDTSILFIDIGHINISFYLIIFNSYSMTVERTWTLQNNGSDYLDKQLLNTVVDYIYSDPISGINTSININEKILKKILINMEPIRKNLNMFDKTTLHIDNLHNTYDLNMEITKEDYLLLYEDTIASFKTVLKIFHNNFDISHVELLGGFSRFNIFSDMITGLTGLQCKKTLNAEETLAKGCCLYGSVISPIYKNINYTIKYKYPHCICILIDNDKKIFIEDEILPLNKDIIKKYEYNRPRLSNKNISIQIYILYEGCHQKLTTPIYNIKHKVSSLITKLSVNVIIGLDMFVKINSISYITSTRTKYNITWEDQPVHMKTYIRYNELLTKYDNEYKNKLKLINTFEEYIYNIDTTRKDELKKANPGIFVELDEWLLNDVYTLDYKECINKIEYFTGNMKC